MSHTDPLDSIPEHGPQTEREQEATWFILNGKTGLFDYRLKGERGGHSTDEVMGVFEEYFLEFDQEGNRENKIPPRFELCLYLLTKEHGRVMVLVGAGVAVSSLIDAVHYVRARQVIHIKAVKKGDSCYCNVHLWDGDRWNEQREKHSSGDAIERFKQSIVNAWKHPNFNAKLSTPYDPADPSRPLSKRPGETPPVQSTARKADTQANIDAQRPPLFAFGYTWPNVPGEAQWNQAPLQKQLDNYEGRFIANDFPTGLTAEELIRELMRELKLPASCPWNSLAGFFLINSFLQKASEESHNALLEALGYAYE